MNRRTRGLARDRLPLKLLCWFQLTTYTVVGVKPRIVLHAGRALEADDFEHIDSRLVVSVGKYKQLIIFEWRVLFYTVASPICSSSGSATICNVRTLLGP
jgi:hypothetical protein